MSKRVTITQDAIVIHGRTYYKAPVVDRPTLRVSWTSSETGERVERVYENCVLAHEGNLHVAYMPPRQGGGILSLEGNAGDNRYSLNHAMALDWRCVDVKDREAKKVSDS
jgi:hypothetical protein